MFKYIIAFLLEHNFFFSQVFQVAQAGLLTSDALASTSRVLEL